MRRVNAVVFGQVQGVGFRWSLQDEARRAGVSGWARNRPDGTVEAEVEGDDQAVQRVLDWLAHGPRFARVSGVQTHDVPLTGASTFDIRS